MRFKIIGGYLDLEPVKGGVQDISIKLKEIADKENKKKKNELELDLKREGRPENII